MNVRRWIGRGLALAAAAAVVVFLLSNAILGPRVEAYEAVRRDLVQTVVASGRIMTPQRVSVGAVTTDRVGRIPVREGQSVKMGEVLIQLDDREERAAAAQAQAAVAQAESKLRQLREVGLPGAEQAWIQAEANLTQARRNYQRMRDLQAKGFISQSALDDAQRNLDVADSQLRSAMLQVQSNGPQGAEIAMAMNALREARAAEALARARLDQMVIRAPLDGILIARNVEEGNVVQPGKELMVLAPAGETQVVLQVDERNLALLTLGQHALVSADAHPRDRFAAELIYINPGIDALRGAVEVKLRVVAPPDYLRQDMTVSADIEVARRAQAVVVPADAVRDADAAQPWVLAIEGRRAHRRAVELGIKGDGRLEVLKGVAPGDRLVAASSALIKDGQRVRATAHASAAP